MAFSGIVQNSLNTIRYGDDVINIILMKRQNIYIYPIEGKVIFPYHEYRFAISTTLYNRNALPIQPSTTTTSLASSPNWRKAGSTKELRRLKPTLNSGRSSRSRRPMSLPTPSFRGIRPHLSTIWASHLQGTPFPI